MSTLRNGHGTPTGSSTTGKQVMAGAASVYDEFMERFVTVTEALTIGDPFDPASTFSTLASKKHFDRVFPYVTPFGGVSDSGVGREGGNFSGEFFTEPKAIVMQIQRDAS